MVYDVAVEPPLYVSVHEIITLSLEKTVVGAFGAFGLEAAIIETSFEKALSPTRFLAFTLNL